MKIDIYCSRTYKMSNRVKLVLKEREWSNFIEDLDNRYQRERQRNKIKKGNKKHLLGIFH